MSVKVKESILNLKHSSKLFFYKNKSILFTISISVLIFMILYYKFLFGGYVYSYSIFGDLGSDTVNVYYPVFMFFSRMIYEGPHDLYSLVLGLGENLMPILSYVNNPFELLTSIVPPEHVHQMLIFVTLLKSICISIFSYKYFNLILKKNTSKIICSLIWTFCGYTILWGQHYAFATCMVYFTIFTYLLHSYIHHYKKNNLKIIVIMTLSALCSYYFFYMFGLFSIIYILIISKIEKIKFRDMIYIILKLGLLALLSMGLAACLLLPSIYLFLNSVRTASIMNIGSLFQINLKTIMTCIARLFSNNILGNAQFVNFSGTSNYYEAAQLSTSLLFVFSMTYMFFCYKTKVLNKVLIIIGYVSLLVFPFFTQLLTFNASAMRWTYMLSLLNVILIGLFIDYLLVSKDYKRIIKITLIGLIISLIAFIFLSYGMRKNLISLDKKEVFMVITVLLVYSILLCFFKTKYFGKILLLSVVCELIIMNYGTINDRGIEKEKAFLSHYNDGTSDAIKEIRKNDISVFRVQKNYISKHLNDAYVQGYNGTNVYSSFNSKNLVNFYNSFELYNKYQTTSCIELDYQNEYYISTLLGEKYVIANSELNSKNFNEISTVGNKKIYINKNYLPFGYLYSQEFSKSYFENLTQSEKLSILTSGYYVTNGSDSLTKSKVKPNVTELDLLRKKNSNIKNEYVFNSGDSLTFDKDVIKKGDSLEFKIFTNLPNNFKIYFDSGSGFSENNVLVQNISPMHSTYQIKLPDLTNVKAIKIVPTDASNPVKITQLNLVKYNGDLIDEEFNKLRENGLQNVTMVNSQLHANINNEMKDNAMLCIPIVYSHDWRAYVDGKKVSTFNINGGLIGIKLGKGTHDIKLVYRIPGLTMGIIISLISAIILLIYIKRKSIYEFIKYRMKKKEG